MTTNRRKNARMPFGVRRAGRSGSGPGFPGLYLFGLLALGCSAGGTVPLPGDAGWVEDGTHVRFDFALAQMSFGDIPFPDDLYRDGDGVIGLSGGDVFGAAGLRGELVADLSTIDGYSPIAPIFMYLDGDIDSETLPQTAQASMLPNASVFLLDIDPSSPSAFSRVPVECHWSAADRRLSVRPARGEPLSGGRKYAVVVTTRVLDADGLPLQPSRNYQAVRDADGEPTDPVQARVYRAHINALTALENVGQPRAELAGLAVFTVQDTARGLSAMASAIDAFDVTAPKVGQAVVGGELATLLGNAEAGTFGVDAVGGVAHENIGWFIQGTLMVPNFLSRAASTPGQWSRDSAGLPIAKRVESLPFTLCLPSLAPADAPVSLPVVAFQHGLGRDRADVLPLANQLNAAGYAVIAIDAPFHGLRAGGATDLVGRFVAGDVSDGFVDGGADTGAAAFLGIGDEGDRAALHPGYLRDAIRQNVADWIVLLKAFSVSSPLGDVVEVPAFSLALDRIGFVGVDVGGQVGLLLTSMDARVDASLLAMTGGGLAEWLITSPAMDPYARGLFEQFGVSFDDTDFAMDSPLFWPSFALWQTLADPGDALAFAPSVRRKPRDLLMVMARGDESVSNRVTETLARALRMPIAVPGRLQFVTLDRVNTPVAQNVTIAGELSTQALFEQTEAAHSLYSQDHDVSEFADIKNPIESALTQAVFFFESWRNGSAQIIDPAQQLRRSSN